jgi:hypothetical protein
LSKGLAGAGYQQRGQCMPTVFFGSIDFHTCFDLWVGLRNETYWVPAIKQPLQWRRGNSIGFCFSWFGFYA